MAKIYKTMVVKMTKSKFFPSMTIIITLLLVLISGCMGVGDSEYVIRISGDTHNLIYSGTYTTVTSGGYSTSKSVQGAGTQEFNVKGKIVSVAVEKEVKEGILKVEILKDGKVVTQAETSAEFGKVSVSTP
jgi:hypothetical protein